MEFVANAMGIGCVVTLSKQRRAAARRMGEDVFLPEKGNAIYNDVSRR